MKRADFSVSTPEIICFSGDRERIDEAFCGVRAETRDGEKFGIKSDLSMLSNTNDFIADLGVQRNRKTIHDWAQRIDLQLELSQAPNEVALDQTEIRIGDQQYWLYAATDPATNELPHVRLVAVTTTVLPQEFLPGSCEKHAVETAEFPIDNAQKLQTKLLQASHQFQTDITDIGLQSSGSSARANASLLYSRTDSASSNQKL